MKILFVLTYLYDRGGDSRHAFSVAEGLVRRGHQVSFFGMEGPLNGSGFPGPLAPHVDYRELLGAGGWTGRLRALGSIYSPAARRAADLFIRKHGPFDLAHVHSVHHQLTMSVLDSLDSAGIPFVWTLHDYKLVCPNTSLFMDGAGEPCPAPGRGAPLCVAARRCKKGSLAASILTAAESGFAMLSGCYDRPACYISPTGFLRELVEEHGVTSRPVVVLPNFSPVPAVETPTSPGKGILFAGRLTPPKGVEILLRAFAAARDAIDGPLVIAGDGEDRRRLAGLARELLPPDSCRFLGAVAGNDAMRSLYLSTGYLVVPSLWIENMPLSILESFACARPVVASDVGGVPELVEEGVTGMLVQSGSVPALADRLVAMSADRASMERMGSAAWEKVRQRHSRDGYIRRLEVIYRTVLKGGFD